VLRALGWLGMVVLLSGCTLADNDERVLPPVRLTVAIEGNGAVSSQPAGIACPPTCSAEFPHDTTVLLTVTAGLGFHGARISCDGGAELQGSLVKVLAADTTCLARFDPDMVIPPPRSSTWVRHLNVHTQLLGVTAGQGVLAVEDQAGAPAPAPGFVLLTSEGGRPQRLAPASPLSMAVVRARTGGFLRAGWEPSRILVEEISQGGAVGRRFAIGLGAQAAQDSLAIDVAGDRLVALGAGNRVVRFNEFDVPAWSVKLDATVRVRAVLSETTGDVLAVGSLLESDGVHRDGWVGRFDRTSSALVMQQRFGEPGIDDEAIAVVRVPDVPAGRVVLAVQLGVDAGLLAFDAGPVPAWTQRFQSSGALRVAGLAASGRELVLAGDDGDDGFLVGLDQTGAVKWQSSVRLGTVSHLTGVAAFENGDFVAVGWADDVPDTIIDDRALLLRLGAGGRVAASCELALVSARTSSMVATPIPLASATVRAEFGVVTSEFDLRLAPGATLLPDPAANLSCRQTF